MNNVVLTQLTQEQKVALMRRILRKSNNSLEVLKLSGEPLVAGWEERAYKQLRKLVHPDKNPGDTRATAAFQRLQDFHGYLVEALEQRAAAPARKSISESGALKR